MAAWELKQRRLVLRCVELSSVQSRTESTVEPSRATDRIEQQRFRLLCATLQNTCLSSMYIYTLFILVIIINVAMCGSLCCCCCCCCRSLSPSLFRSVSVSPFSPSFALAVPQYSLKFRSGSFLSFAFASPYVSFSFNSMAISTTLKSPEKAQPVSYMQLSKWNGSFETHTRFEFGVRAKTLHVYWSPILFHLIWFCCDFIVFRSFRFVSFYK